MPQEASVMINVHPCNRFTEPIKTTSIFPSSNTCIMRLCCTMPMLHFKQPAEKNSTVWADKLTKLEVIFVKILPSLYKLLDICVYVEAAS